MPKHKPKSDESPSAAMIDQLGAAAYDVAPDDDGGPVYEPERAEDEVAASADEPRADADQPVEQEPPSADDFGRAMAEQDFDGQIKRAVAKEGKRRKSKAERDKDEQLRRDAEGAAEDLVSGAAYVNRPTPAAAADSPIEYSAASCARSTKIHALHDGAALCGGSEARMIPGAPFSLLDADACPKCAKRVRGAANARIAERVGQKAAAKRAKQTSTQPAIDKPAKKAKAKRGAAVAVASDATAEADSVASAADGRSDSAAADDQNDPTTSINDSGEAANESGTAAQDDDSMAAATATKKARKGKGATTKAAAKSAGAKAKSGGKKAAAAKAKSAKAPKAHANGNGRAPRKSKDGGPTSSQIVRSLYDKNPNVRYMDTINAAVAQGVHPDTARGVLNRYKQSLGLT